MTEGSPPSSLSSSETSRSSSVSRPHRCARNESLARPRNRWASRKTSRTSRNRSASIDKAFHRINPTRRTNRIVSPPCDRSNASCRSIHRLADQAISRRKPGTSTPPTGWDRRTPPRQTPRLSTPRAPIRPLSLQAVASTARRTRKESRSIVRKSCLCFDWIWKIHCTPYGSVTPLGVEAAVRRGMAVSNQPPASRLGSTPAVVVCDQRPRQPSESRPSSRIPPPNDFLPPPAPPQKKRPEPVGLGAKLARESGIVHGNSVDYEPGQSSSLYAEAKSTKSVSSTAASPLKSATPNGPLASSSL